MANQGIEHIFEAAQVVPSIRDTIDNLAQHFRKHGNLHDRDYRDLLKDVAHQIGVSLPTMMTFIRAASNLDFDWESAASNYNLEKQIPHITNSKKTSGRQAGGPPSFVAIYEKTGKNPKLKDALESLIFHYEEDTNFRDSESRVLLKSLSSKLGIGIGDLVAFIRTEVAGEEQFDKTVTQYHRERKNPAITNSKDTEMTSSRKAAQEHSVFLISEAKDKKPAFRKGIEWLDEAFQEQGHLRDKRSRMRLNEIAPMADVSIGDLVAYIRMKNLHDYDIQENLMDKLENTRRKPHLTNSKDTKMTSSRRRAQTPQPVQPPQQGQAPAPQQTPAPQQGQAPQQPGSGLSIQKIVGATKKVLGFSKDLMTLYLTYKSKKNLNDPASQKILKKLSTQAGVGVKDLTTYISKWKKPPQQRPGQPPAQQQVPGQPLAQQQIPGQPPAQQQIPGQPAQRPASARGTKMANRKAKLDIMTGFSGVEKIDGDQGSKGSGYFPRWTTVGLPDQGRNDAIDDDQQPTGSGAPETSFPGNPLKVPMEAEDVKRPKIREGREASKRKLQRVASEIRLLDPVLSRRLLAASEELAYDDLSTAALDVSGSEPNDVDDHQDGGGHGTLQFFGTDPARGTSLTRKSSRRVAEEEEEEEEEEQEGLTDKDIIDDLHVSYPWVDHGKIAKLLARYNGDVRRVERILKGYMKGPAKMSSRRVAVPCSVEETENGKFIVVNDGGKKIKGPFNSKSEAEEARVEVGEDEDENRAGTLQYASRRRANEGNPVQLDNQASYWLRKFPDADMTLIYSLLKKGYSAQGIEKTLRYEQGRGQEMQEEQQRGHARPQQRASRAASRRRQAAAEREKGGKIDVSHALAFVEKVLGGENYDRGAVARLWENESQRVSDLLKSGGQTTPTQAAAPHVANGDTQRTSSRRRKARAQGDAPLKPEAANPDDDGVGADGAGGFAHRSKAPLQKSMNADDVERPRIRENPEASKSLWAAFKNIITKRGDVGGTWNDGRYTISSRDYGNTLEIQASVKDREGIHMPVGNMTLSLINDSPTGRFASVELNDGLIENRVLEFTMKPKMASKVASWIFREASDLSKEALEHVGVS